MKGKSETSETGAKSLTMTRRGTMMYAAAFAAAGTATAGSASAASSLNFDSEFVPTPQLGAEATIGTHDRSRMLSELEYIDDNGDIATLADYGGAVASRPVDADDDEPWNPVTIEPKKIDADDFYQFPRDETDDDDDPITALEPDHWDEGGTTVTEGGADTEYSLTIEGDGEAVFDAFDPISDGVRRELQFIITAPSLDAEIEVGVRDDAGNEASVMAGPDADADADDVFATELPDAGVVVQREIGELYDGFGDIVEVFVSVGADQELTLTALNAERESQWTLGQREYQDTDDDDTTLETETLYEPVGAFSITGIDTLGSTFDDAAIHDLHVDAEVSADKLPTERVDSHFEDDDRFPGYDVRATLLYTVSLPSGYDISVTADALTDEQSTFDDRYNAAGVYEDVSDVPPYTYDDYVDDTEDGDPFVDVTQEYDGGVGNEVTLLDNVGSGTDTVVHYEMLLTDAEQAEVTAGGAAGGGFGRQAASRIWSVPGMIISAIGAAGIYQWFRGGGE